MAYFAHIHRQVHPVAEVDDFLDGGLSRFSPVAVAGVHDLVVVSRIGEGTEIAVPLGASQQDDVVAVYLTDGCDRPFVEWFQRGIQLFHVFKIRGDRFVDQFVS